jgi:hypothetical protein
VEVPISAKHVSIVITTTVKIFIVLNPVPIQTFLTSYGSFTQAKFAALGSGENASDHDVNIQGTLTE